MGSGSVGFVNGEEVDLEISSGMLSTLEAKPLVIKKLIVTVYVDGKKISNPICNCENLSQLVTITAQKIDSILHPCTWVDNGTKLKSDFKKFILDTPEN